MRLSPVFLIAAVTVASAASVDKEPSFGPNQAFRLESSQDSFGVRSHGITEMVDGRPVFYPLPQSTRAEYLALRAEDAKINPLAPDRYERVETIGPWQLEGNVLWFGKQFYDGEGMKGVGAFGFFDTETRHYTLYSPPEIARYEISAILVQPEWVWLGLDRFGEDISTSPGGLVRWNRATGETRRYPLEFGIGKITEEGGALRLQTHLGYALFRDEKVQRFLANGKEIRKFPPPPSHY